MKLNQLYNKELREKLLKKDMDDFLRKYSDFMDEQIENRICYLIDEWYLEWREKLFDSVVGHAPMFGHAKEKLKQLLCGISDSGNNSDENNTHPLFTQLFLDLDKIHTYANCLYCEKDDDEKERLIENIDTLFDKWKDYMLKKAEKDNRLSLILDS
ncbi:MAG: hypothetical protein EHM34_09295 [Nitrosopumilales archaeon]|nr:MAG: hypothetical protein EHM34_09295 [Nitrosopumilales archaeon]